jgi:transcriptional regulator with XRE-family HTH domain
MAAELAEDAWAAAREDAANLRWALKQARMDAGYRQGQVAELMQVTQGTVSNIESGRTQFGLETIALIARICGKKVVLVDE